MLQAPGRIFVNDAIYPCTIYDKSRTGVRLIKFGKLQLPPTFSMTTDATGEHHACWLIWQVDDEAGVSFDKPSDKPAYPSD